MQKLVRHYEDVGLSVEVTAPADWLEFEVDGALWCLARPVEEGLAPNVTLNIARADSADSAIESVKAGVRELGDVEIGMEQVDTSGNGSTIAIGYAFRPPEGSVLAQTLMCSVVEAPGGPWAVTIVGTCAGDSPQELLDEVGAATASLRVRART